MAFLRRLLTWPIRVFEDLPIGLKLALTSLGALSLLSFVSWYALDRLSVVGSLQDGVALYADEERTIRRGLLAALEIRVISRELENLQSVGTVRKAVEQATEQHRIARQILDGAIESHTDAAARARLVDAADRLDDLLAVVKQAAGMRIDIIATRQKKLFQVRGMYETSVQTLGSEMTRGAVVQGGVEAVRNRQSTAEATFADPVLDELQQFQLAMARVQGGALMFMATAQGSAANDVRDGIVAARKHMAVILGSTLPDAVKESARLVETLANGIAQASLDLIAQTRQLDNTVRTTVDEATRQVRVAFDQVGDLYAQRVRNAAEQAQEGRQQAQFEIIVMIGVIALLVVVLGGFTTVIISLPIRRLTVRVQGIARGDIAQPVGFSGRRDEAGRMAAAVETLRGVMRQTFVQSQMIEQLPIGVMTVDPKGTCPVTYCNPAMLRTLEPVQAQLGTSPDRLVGRPADPFHENPEILRALLSDPSRLPHRHRITLGDETLEWNATAIRDRFGEYTGAMLTWTVLTGQVRLVEQFDQSVGAVASAVGQAAGDMQQSAQVMSDAAADSGQRIAAVVEASTQASQHVSAAAAGAEELAVSVTEISRQVADSALIASRAVQEAEATDRSIGGLSEAAERINEVVRLISDIAGRTNLLALNATIEAARAGDAGKGFAVVAGEVKTLATQTARATDEISAQISAMQQATNQAVTALRSIGGTIQRMHGISTAIAGAVEEQGAATQEIARAVQLAASGTADVDSHISAVRGAVEATDQHAGTVLDGAVNLTEQAAKLRSEVQQFLSAIQQAA
ncbi:MAG: methyl-accepting chemotaxis protein [Acetobacteraceae bacterium]